MNTTPPPLIDIGANLSHSAFEHDLDSVLEQARVAGVGHIIVTGTDLESVQADLRAQIMEGIDLPGRSDAE